MKKSVYFAAVFLALGYLPLHAEDAKKVDLGAPESGVRMEMVDIKAKVIDIDYPTRMVTLEDAGGSLTVRVDDAVKDLKKVKKGDKVEIQYQKTVAWRLLPKNKKVKPTETTTKVVTTTPGQSKPEVTRTSETSVISTITAIDKAVPSVTLKQPDGTSFTVKIRRPEALEGVKVGDQVEITYVESVAAVVKKVKK